MNMKKHAIAVGLAGAGLFAARTLGPKLHDRCKRMCAGGNSDGVHESEQPHESAGRRCARQAVCDDALVA